MTQTRCNTFCKNWTNRRIKQLSKTIKLSKNTKSDASKSFMNNCKRAYCNPGCKDTMFQSGKRISQKLSRKIKSPVLRNWLLKTRKHIFGKKTSVLNSSSFYNKLPRDKVADAKSRGAVSGCTIGFMD